MSIGIQQQLQRYARPLRSVAEIDDNDFPFSFRVWFESYQSIIPGQEYSQYNQYLVDWYKSKSEETQDKNLQIKLNYLKLIKQLQLFFPEQEVENWYNGIDLNNDKELFLAIPYFAKKLKDIALYYLNLRENIKLSKIKYNLAGSNTGLSLQLQEFLLTNYTKKPNNSIAIPASVWRSAPELSSVRDTINIQIEELYDTFSYFDQSPTVPVSSYYQLNTPAIEQYFNSLGLTLTSAEWIFKTGVFDVSGNDIIETINISEALANKYLGSNKFSSLNISFSTNTKFYEIPIVTGNNFFYWPYGPYKSNITNLPRFQPVSLSSVRLETIATAGSSLDIADTIFIKTKNDVKGAWLRNQLYEEKVQSMRANLNAQTTTRFRFPYPGFGLSGEDLEWTGFSLENDSRFFFLDDVYKQAVEERYWTTQPGLTSYTPIYINSTNLVNSQAQPSTDYITADKIRVWTDTPQYTDPSYTGPVKEAWLYKMQQTDISIAPEGDTTILWPYFQINPDLEYPSEFVPEFIDSCCLPTPLSSINFPYSVASSTITNADKIYKIQNYQDTPEQAIECVWLSGKEIFYNSYKTATVAQPGLNIIFQPGTFTKFIWQGDNNTLANEVFKSIDHQPDCKYVTTPGTTYNNHALCTCRQVLFAPFGHPGEIFTDNTSYSDFIVEAPVTGSFNFSNWRDELNRPALSSTGFTWFKTNNKIGWGQGSWVTGISGVPLTLKQGKTYFYYRQNTKTTTQDNIFPEYVIRYPYNNFNQNNFKWVQANKTSNDTWENTNTPSGLILYPGDHLIYSRQPVQTFTAATSTLSSVVVNENRGSIWTNFDYLTIDVPDSELITFPQQFTLSYPSVNTYTPTNEKQYPATNINNFVDVLVWSVSAPNTPIRYFYNTPSLVITPTQAGTYIFSVTAMSATTIPPRTIFVPSTAAPGTFYYTNTGYYIFNDIPAVTAVPLQSVVYPPTASNYQAPGFVLNTPLYGWDYNSSTPTNNITDGDLGAKPIWVASKTDKDEFTDFKGVEAWGNYIRNVNQYNFIQQPETSNIILSTGTYVEYHRVANFDTVWQQPLQQKILIDKNTWSTIVINPTAASNLQTILNINLKELVTNATTSASPIVLESVVDNEPVEIYYNSLKPFTWSITAVPVISETTIITTSAQQITNIERPFNNFSHRYYPNIAILPTVQNLYSISDIGGFFVPKNLGVSQYLNKDYTINTILTSSAISSIFEDPNDYLGGRGLTKQDQQTPYEIAVENSIWLKEPAIAGPIAGTIKKNIFKKYQKFIPYQTRYESNPSVRYGLSTPTSLQTPWTGPTDTDWNDPLNFPKSFTGEINVDTWVEDQILKRSNLQLDNWCTDVFGNQYGLYKDIKNVKPKNRKDIYGEIWVRKNSQRVFAGSVGLSGIFDTYKNTSIFDQLIGTGIKHIDVFFDTIYIQTSGAVIFERIIYEYPTDNILSLADEARYISLAMPVETNLNKEIQGISLSDYTFATAGETWFFPERKEVIQTICGLSGGNLTCELFSYDLNTLILKKIFPIIQEDITTINSLSDLGITRISSPLISYNNLKAEYVVSVLGRKHTQQDVLIEFKIKDLPTLVLDQIIIYDSISPTTQTLPPYVDQILYYTLAYGQNLNIQVNTNDNTAIFEAVDLPAWANISSTGLVTGTIPEAGFHYLTFKVTNSVGPTFYTVTIFAIDPQPPIIVIDASNTTGTVPLSVTFTGVNQLPASAAPVATWLWNLTGSNVPVFDTQTVTYVYDTIGTYVVNLTGLNPLHTRTSTINVIVLPLLSFTRNFVTNKTLNHGIGPDITFVRSSSATYYDQNGVLQVIGPDLPRFDHVPSTGDSLGLLIEEQRANLFTYSEELDNSSAWTTTRAVVSANFITSPTTLLNADKLVETNETGAHHINKSLSFTAGTAYTLSVYLKAGERTIARLQFGNTGGVFTPSTNGAYFNVGNGTVFGVGSTTKASITNVGNGWYRCSITSVAQSTGTDQVFLPFLVSSGTTTSYTGDNTSGLYVWGSQLEAGSFPTSYIPTTTTTETRNADTTFIIPVSSFYDPDEGTIVVHSTVSNFLSVGAFPQVISLEDSNDQNNRINIASTNSDLSLYQYANITANGFTQFFGSSSTYNIGEIKKTALAYKEDSTAFATSGLIASTASNIQLPLSIDTLSIGYRKTPTNAYFLNGHIREITFYTQRLTNQELEQLTL